MSEMRVGRASVNVASRLLASIFDNLDKMDANRFAYTHVDGKEDITEHVLDENGRFDPEKAEKNALVSEVDYELAPMLRDDMVRMNIPFGWATIVEPARGEGGTATPRTFFFYPKKEEQNVNAVIDEFVRRKDDRTPKSPEELVNWIRSNGGDPREVASIEIEKDLYDFINRTGYLNIPRTEIQSRDEGYVKLCVPYEMGEGALESVKMAEVLYTGSFRQADRESHERTHEHLSDLTSSVHDSLRNNIIVNEAAPYCYIRKDETGFRVYMDTEKGSNVIQDVKINDRELEQKFYNAIRAFERPVELTGDNREQKLKEMQERGPVVRETTVEERVHKLKREHVDQVQTLCELAGTVRGREGGNCRLMDDQYRLKAAIDTFIARGEGFSSQANDLRGDVSAIGRISSSRKPAESTKDLSDLGSQYSREEIRDGFEKFLGVDTIYATKEQADTKMKTVDDLMDAIAKEPAKVQEKIIEELEVSIREVFERNYREIDYTRDNEQGLAIESIDLEREAYHQERSEFSLDLSR